MELIWKYIKLLTSNFANGYTVLLVTIPEFIILLSYELFEFLNYSSLQLSLTALFLRDSK